MISVPMAIVGALIPLFFGAATMNIYTQVGLLTLVGLISKHGILMVEFANELQLNEGLDRRSAIEMAARVRLRPILMTTAAMVTGPAAAADRHGRGRGEPVLDRACRRRRHVDRHRCSRCSCCRRSMWRSPPITGQGPNPSGPRRSRISIWVRRRSRRPEGKRPTTVDGCRLGAAPVSQPTDAHRSKDRMPRTKRREFLTLLGAAALTIRFEASAGTPGRIPDAASGVGADRTVSPFGKI